MPALADHARVETALGYQFRNKSFLANALTHRSFSADHNERLEFLGDAVLELVVSDFLYQHFPEASEGQLSRLRAQVVKGKTLAAIARELDLGPHICLSIGEKKCGGQDRDSTLADALEALLGAVYLDAGLESCRCVILQCFKTQLDQLTLDRNIKDAKSRLQELLQAKAVALPAYHVAEITGEAHDQCFHVHCEIAGLDILSSGQGRNRKAAEQAAAAHALELVEKKL